MNSVKSLTLGTYNSTTITSTNKSHYNDLIQVLNNEASKYNNSTYSERARSVGTIPNNPTSDSPGYFSSSYSYMSPYNGQFKNADTHYTTDWNQMGTLGIQNIGTSYWLASREVTSHSVSSVFSARSVRSDGTLWDEAIILTYVDGIPFSETATCGIRPIFKLKSSIKVTGGNGTSSSPYTLGV